jgi:hypothetical protein
LSGVTLRSESAGDSTFNTQLYATLGALYASTDTVAAFTVFQLLQNLGSAVVRYALSFFIFL